MSTAPQPLSLEEFHSRYRQQKPHFEYWFGEPIQKATPTWFDAVLQIIIGEALRRAGYKSGSEVELRIDPQWEPVPDVIGTLKSIKDYPTEPVEIAVEILSPDDKLMHVVQRCHQYQTDWHPATIRPGPYRQIGLAVESVKLGSNYAVVAA